MTKKESFISNKNILNKIQSKVSKLLDKSSVDKLVKTLSQRYEKRKGGYSRIIKAGFRYGDDASLAIIELVDRDIEAKRVDLKKKSDETPKSPPVTKTENTEKKTKSKK